MNEELRMKSSNSNYNCDDSSPPQEVDHTNI